MTQQARGLKSQSTEFPIPSEIVVEMTRLLCPKSCHWVRITMAKDDSMKEIEERARSFYEGPISLSSKEFVEMLILDGCFVLELFRGATECFKTLGYSRNDPIFAIRGSMHSIQRNMIMLENQLPLLVLDLPLGIQLGNPNFTGLVANLALRFFDPLMPTDKPSTKSDISKLESSLRGTAPFDPLGDRDGLTVSMCFGEVYCVQDLSDHFPEYGSNDGHMLIELLTNDANS